MTSRYTVARQRSLQQMRGRMERKELNRREDITVGNQDLNKLDSSIIVTFQNIKGFGFDKDQAIYQRIFNFLKKYKIDKLDVKESYIYCPKINVKIDYGIRQGGWFEGLSTNPS